MEAVEETSRGIEIMCVHGHDQPVNHIAHQVLPGLVGCCANTRPHGARRCTRRVRRLKVAAAADASHPDTAAHRRIRTSRDRAHDVGLDINLRAMHDESSFLGTVRSSANSNVGTRS